ncbi:MAG TPA: GNAT family N-acetyltransferase [Nitrospiraceae bacterium]|nr:MAG: GNAT family N-acetyltransferase [Nitrospirae bacterium GWA2_46_11]OGW23611.1 MAG: GNAT family N-acetyltransferase [Nitrospirae bacterium GWB2_47_37]HAK89985.1 GNAT family N-acetyltransferase [Nitrospiraceae bacterium]HCL81279.1 GNAT family N-acetyltransferase [Nitrospiraceae bacterium]HCZ11876.1 GNAT family N-acetyltransferase [Nitrospiraceae bacterium]
MKTVRPANTDDLGSCIELLGLLFGQEHEFKPNPTAQRRGLEMIVKNPETGSVFVCESNGVIQGMVVVLFTISTALGKKVALLEDMVVSPDSRGKGVGTSLIKHAVEFAINNGCGRITLLTDNDNEQAHEFYRKHGFTKSNMVVFRKLLKDSVKD